MYRPVVPRLHVNPGAQSVSIVHVGLHFRPSVVQTMLLHECAAPTTQSPLPLQLLSVSMPEEHVELQTVLDVGYVHACVLAPSHELAHVQNGHILYATALHYLNTSAAFFVRWVVQPAIMTLQAWSRRAEVTCDRASLIAVRDLDKTLTAMVRLELGLDKGSAFNAEEYLKAPPDLKKGVGRYAELFRSHPYVPKRVAALKLFGESALALLR